MPRQQPSPRALQTRLLRWFERHRRDLPWRRSSDPYRVWLAESMLQQTRVPVVVPYYQRFLKAFPSVKKLAQARLDRVLRLWAGLGYYERARNLHAGAKEIVRRHGGHFPPTLEAALALPGVGPYTARAVLSIAYQKPLAVVDGNVARALARLYRWSQPDVNERAALQPLADRLISPQRPGDFNQALMELGSTICLPKIPRCHECPLERICAARQAGLEHKIPLRRRKRQRGRVRLNVLVVRRNGDLLLVREPHGYFSGLWHFPYTQSQRPDKLAQALGVNGTRHRVTLIHQTTMRDLVLRVYEAHTQQESKQIPEKGRWVRPAQLTRLAVGAATRKIAQALKVDVGYGKT